MPERNFLQVIGPALALLLDAYFVRRGLMHVKPQA